MRQCHHFQKKQNLICTFASDDGFTDVTLHLGRHGSQTSVVNCHRVVLAAQSPVFAQLFHQGQSGNKVWIAIRFILKNPTGDIRFVLNSTMVADFTSYISC